MALPAEIEYGQVKWSVVSSAADGVDADGQPDAVPVAGTVTFTPSATVLLAMGAAPVTVIATSVTYTLDSAGVLRDSQNRDLITLVATDSAGITPTGWTWSATYNLGGGLSRGSFSFELPADAVVDLTTVAPVASSNGASIIQGPAGPPGVSTDATDTAKGIVELATVGETTTGTDTARAVTPAGVKAVTDLVKFDLAGDNVALFNTWVGRDRDLRRGTTAAPVAGGGSMVKLSQTEKITNLATQMGGNAVDNEANSALHVAAACGAGSLGQVSAVTATAKGAPLNTDVVALTAIGSATGNNGRGTGAYLEGRTNVTTANAAGAELRVQNESGANSWIQSTDISGAVGLWVTTASSTGHNSSVGVALGRVKAAVYGITEESQFTYGFQITNGTVADSAYRDEAGSYASFVSVGAHTIGLDLSSGAFTGFAISLPATTTSAGGVAFGNDVFLFRNGAGSLYVDASSGVVFNANFTLSDGRNFSLGPTAGTKFGLSTGQKLAFYGATPIVRPSATPAAATDAATTQTLVNDLRAKLVALGLIG